MLREENFTEKSSEDDQCDAWKFPWFKGRKDDTVSHGVLRVTKDSDFYNMSHKPRGKCIIFITTEFDAHLRFIKRSTSDDDVKNLEHCFSELGFEVTIHKNFSSHQIAAELERVASENHTDNDCFVCIIITYGGEGFLCGTNGKFTTSSLFKPFLENKSRTLAGKPKLFFIQACQAEKVDYGILRTPEETTDSNKSYKIPNQADFLVHYSTVPDFSSWKNTHQESWFIQAFCDVLKGHAKNKDLLEMLTLLNHRVAQNFAYYESNNINMMLQLPYIYSSLTRKVYFGSKKE